MNDTKCPNCLAQNTQLSMFGYTCCMCGASWELENGKIAKFSVNIKRMRANEITPRSIAIGVRIKEDIIRDIVASTDLEELARLGRELSRSTRRFLSPRVLATLLAKEQGGKCNGCLTKPTKHNMQVDHIIPLAKGGETRLDNLQMLCNGCNRLKGTGSMDELVNKLVAENIREATSE